MEYAHKETEKTDAQKYRLKCEDWKQYVCNLHYVINQSVSIYMYQAKPVEKN